MNLISAYQLSKSFASKKLFKNISFSIETGQRIGLIGPNGAGKSTLLKGLRPNVEFNLVLQQSVKGANSIS